MVTPTQQEKIDLLRTRAESLNTELVDSSAKLHPELLPS